MLVYSEYLTWIFKHEFNIDLQWIFELNIEKWI